MARLSQLQGVLLRTNQGGLFADSPGVMLRPDWSTS